MRSTFYGYRQASPPLLPGPPGEKGGPDVPIRHLMEIIRRLPLGAKFTLLLALVFVTGMVTSWIALSRALESKAEHEVVSKANMLLKAMNSVRQYTSENINVHVKPLLDMRAGFIRETVPGYSASRVFEFFRKDREYRDFRYKEATLNPTNPADKADEFETGLVERFRSDPHLTEQSGFRRIAGNEVFFTARPIRVQSASCLECHSTPAAAPASMRARYGTENGYGWRMDEVVGSQLVYVPAGRVESAGRQSALLVTGIFTSIFALAALAITVFFRRVVVRPLGGLAAATHALTRGRSDTATEAPHAAPADRSGDEIGRLAAHFDFMAREVYSREERLQSALGELTQSQSRLVSAQRIAQLGHWDWDLVRDHVVCSDEIYRILGLDASAFTPTSKGLVEIVHADDREALRAAIAEALRNRQPLDHEWRIVRPDGTVRVVHQQGEVTYNAEGRAVHVQGTVQDITDRKNADERIRRLALYDSLTGLPNRHLFKEQLGRAIAAAPRDGRTIVLLSLGLDRFKRVNETLGHAGGDLLLKETAARLAKSLRPSDYVGRDEAWGAGHSVGRPGGDEFTLLLAVQQAEDAAKVARRVLDALARPFGLDGNEIVVSASVGIALYPLDGNDAETLLKNADSAMHFAKEQGKSDYQYYNKTMNATAIERLALEADLRRAVERNELGLFYQPKVDVKTGAIVGVEALMRWRHPQLGLVSPAQFIPLAEEIGLILPMGEWALRAACAQIRRWLDAGIAAVPVAVNISARQFHQQDIASVVDRALREHAVDPGLLDLEITEGTAMHDVEATSETLRELKALGVTIAIDDFGTGYSSLSYLKRFPIDSLKIDRSFVVGLPGDQDDGSIAQAVITMAHALRLKVVAEGVENEAQLEFLAKNDCDQMQGFHFSRPVTAEACTEMLRARGALPPARALEGIAL
ncbi:MAG TPA: EAL domain-containing protein [Burkholderiales bacterium]|nr:EAL domain-containing protein [Burkholderiales bacterium]